MIPTAGGSKDMFDQYLTQLLHGTTSKSHLPPIQRGQHHVFSAEHTTRDILSFMAQVQGLNLPSEYEQNHPPSKGNCASLTQICDLEPGVV